MRKVLLSLFAVLFVFSTLTASAAKPKPRKKEPKEVPVHKVVREAEEEAEKRDHDRDRRAPGVKTDDDEIPIEVHPNPIPTDLGPATELRITKAGSKKFDLRSLPFTGVKKRERPERHLPAFRPGVVNVPPVVQPPDAQPPQPNLNAPAPGPIITFDGLDFNNWGAGHPPDTNGDVGPTYFIQTINTSIGIYRKSDGVRVAAFTFDTFMSQGNFGNLCDTDNFGDPVVLYDTFEDRWIITDFAFQLDGSNNVINPPGNFQCFAVSMTNDPVAGGWNYYSINTTGGLGDYPKLGIWPDGLYLSVNMFDYAASGSFQNTRLYALNKAQMYAGSPTVKVVSFDLPSDQFTALPSNARLQTGTPPAGSPNYFASIANFLNSMQIWKFHVDWDHIPLSTVTGPFNTTMTFWWQQYSRGGLDTAPTPANANDTLYPRLMMQNQYSNIGGVESLWNSHTVGAGNPTTNQTSAQSAIRYYQVNVNGGTVAATTAQSFTYSPDATMFRYMPSVAVNRNGDMAIGYTTSNATTNPGLSYAGRLNADAANSITLTEQTLYQGTGSQSGNCGGTCERWGDYSTMTLDPNGCVFWYTNEYYATNGLNHQTRIGSFDLGGCTPVGNGGTLQGTVTATTGGAPISGATVNLGARTTTTNASGFYRFTGIPAGTHPYVTASRPGYTSSTVTDVPITDGGTTVRDFSLATASSGSCPVDTTQSDFQGGVGTNIDLAASVGDVQLAKPDVLNQANSTVSPTGFAVTNTSWVAQTFTPTLSGNLVRADLELFCSGCSGANPNLTFSIRATTVAANPLPTGADLASATLTGFNDGGAGGLKTVTFSSPLAVTAGTRYALVVRSTAARTGSYAYTCSCATTGFVNSNPYTTGQRTTSTNSGSSWTADTTSGGRDLNFRIYINAGYPTSGELLSSVKDSNPGLGNLPTWTTLSWTGSTPANTGLQFQAAASNNVNGPYTFVGPDGTASTFFTTSGASISQFNGLRYLRYRANLTSTVNTATPTLNDVTVCFADTACSATGPVVTPASNPVCSGATGRTASAPAGFLNYSWAITNGTITAGINSQNVTFTAGTSGNVDLQLTVTDNTGCIKTTNISIPIETVPTPSINAGGPTTFCAGGSVTLTSSSATGNQWYLDGNPIGGATNQNYIATTAGSYTVRVTTVNGCVSAISSATVVAVNPAPATPSVNAGGPTTFCAGGSVTLTSSSPTGNQWYLNGNPIGGETNQTLVVTATGNYTVVVTASGCPSAPSSATSVTVNPIPATPTINAGGPTTFCNGGSVTLTSSSATGNQWYLDGNPIGGATNQNYVATASGNYTVVVTNSGCSSAASSATSVTVTPGPSTPTINAGGPTTFCAGGSVTLTSSSATGNQWYLDGNPIGGATNQNYSATATGNYTVVVTTSGCSSAPSSATSVTVTPAPSTPTINAGGPTSFCTGGSVTLTSSSATGNQWYLNGNPIGGETNQNYIATATGNYTVVVTQSGCPSAPSAATSVTVNPIPSTPTINAGGPTTFCAGGSVTLTSSSASGNQWYLNGNPIGGATNQNYSATATGNYTVVVTTSGCSSAPSSATSVTVNPAPSTPTINAGGPTTFCTGGSVTLTSSSATGNQWYLNGNPIGGATNQNYSATATGNYTVVVTTSGCSSAPSSATSVTVNPTPSTPTINAGGPTTFCAGGSVTLTSSSASGNQWYLNGNPIGGATNQNYSANATGNYTVVVTNGGCSSAPSSATSVTVNPAPSTPTINASGPTTFCTGGSVTLTSSSASGNQWYLNGNPIGGETNQTYIATTAGDYTVVVTSSGCSSAPSSTTTVTVNATPNATITAPSNVAASSTGNVASVAAAPGGSTYNWGITNGTITAGTGTNSITFTAGAAGTLTLNVTVTTPSTCSDAKSANVTVTAVGPTVNVTSVSPNHGPTAGNTNVTISGSGFAAGAAVTFGGSAATNVVVVNATTITAKTPAHAIGAVNVTVTNTDTSNGTLNSGYTYTINFDPNGDNTVDPSDIFYLINYLFLGGPAPAGSAGMPSGDANGDGSVDPADIFYIVNYLFGGGPAPHATRTRPATNAIEQPVGGALRLGNAVQRDGHWFVPVMLTMDANAPAPQALSLRVAFDGAVDDASVRRTTAAQPIFEVSRNTGDAIAYLVAFNDNAPLTLDASRSAVIAEIEVSAPGAVRLTIDPQLTMLIAPGMEQKASVANRNLRVSGTVLNRVAPTLNRDGE